MFNFSEEMNISSFDLSHGRREFIYKAGQ